MGSCFAAGLPRWRRSVVTERAGLEITVRFQRKNPASRVVVYYKGERMGEARLLNAVANDRPPKRPGSDPGQAASGALSVKPKTPAPAPAATAEKPSNH